MARTVCRLDGAHREDFYRLHCGDQGWCYCAAWWVDTWEGWGERTAEQNRAVRDGLFARGEHDGYLLHEDGEPAGWCQVGPRDRLAKLSRQLALAADPGAWAVTCFLVAPAARRRGVASHLLGEVLADLRRRGARRVEAYPKRGPDLDPSDLWTGPERLFLARGFRVERDDPRRPVLGLDLAAED